MVGLRVGLLAASFCAAAGMAKSEAIKEVVDQPFLNMLGHAEGPDGYDDIVLAATSQPPQPLSTMTVGEVLDYQQKLRDQGSGSTAAGRYQIIRKTLNEFVDRGDVTLDAKFDRHTQDMLARIMMNRCGFYNPERDITRLGNCLARAWAALPVLSGDLEGKSYYDGKNGNEAKVSKDDILAVLDTRLQVAPVQRVTWTPAPPITNKEQRFADPIPLVTQATLVSFP